MESFDYDLVCTQYMRLLATVHHVIKPYPGNNKQAEGDKSYKNDKEDLEEEGVPSKTVDDPSLLDAKHIIRLLVTLASPGNSFDRRRECRVRINRRFIILGLIIFLLASLRRKTIHQERAIFLWDFPFLWNEVEIVGSHQRSDETIDQKRA